MPRKGLNAQTFGLRLLLPILPSVWMVAYCPAMAMELGSIDFLDIRKSDDGRILEVEGSYDDPYAFVHPRLHRYGSEVNVDATTSWFGKGSTQRFVVMVPLSERVERVTFGRRRSVIWSKDCADETLLIDPNESNFPRGYRGSSVTSFASGLQGRFRSMTEQVQVQVTIEDGQKAASKVQPLSFSNQTAQTWEQWCKSEQFYTRHRFGRKVSDIANSKPLECTVEFSIDARGRVKESRLVEESPNCLFNSLALASVQSVGKWLPEDVPADTVIKILAKFSKDPDPAGRNFFFFHEEPRVGL